MTKKISRILLVLLSLCAYSMDRASAQEMASAKPGTDAVSTIRNISNPVNLSTGTMTVSVPLCRIESHGLTVPIGLTYSATEVRVEDKSGAVGLGWNLQAGGKVTRIVKQQPDTQVQSYWGRTIQQMYSVFFEGKNTGYNRFNSEPDQFYYEVPGASGMFVLDASGNAVTIPHQNINIQFISGAYFKISTPDGNTYWLGMTADSRETSTVEFSSTDKNSETVKNTYTSTWHLEKAQSYTGQTVTYRYQAMAKIEDVSENFVSRIFLDYNNVEYITSEIKNTCTVVTTPIIPKEISWDYGKIEFSLGSSKENLMWIYVYNNSKLLQTIGFSYFNFPNNSFVGLKNIYTDYYQEGQSDSQFIAAFEYFSDYDFPRSDTKDFDSWGYWNNAGNKLNYAEFRLNGLSLGASRKPVFDYTKAYTLKAVIHPGGARTDYEYELHEYMDNNEKKKAGGGLRIKAVKVSDQDGPVKTILYDYTKPDGSSSGLANEEVITFIPHFASSSNTPGGEAYSKPINDIYDPMGQYIHYSTVKEINPDDTYTIYEFTSASESENQNFYTEYYSGIDKESPSLSMGPARDRTITPSSSRAWRRGLPLKITRFDKNGKVIFCKENEYTIPEASKKIVKGYTAFYKDISGVYKGVASYHHESAPVFLSKKTVHPNAVLSGSVTEYIYDTRYMVPTEIRTTVKGAGENIVTREIITYPFSYAPGQLLKTSEIYPMWLLYDRGITIPVETYTIRDGKVIAANLTTYGYHTPEGTIDDVALPYETYTLATADGIPANDFKPLRRYGESYIRDDRYILESRVEQYDQAMNAVTVCDRAGTPASVYYGYNHSLPIAEVFGAVVSEPGYTIREVNPENYQNGVPFRTEVFNIPYRQTVSFKIGRATNDGYPGIVASVRIYNADTGYQFYSDMFALYSAQSKNYNIDMPAGNYYVLLTDDDRVAPSLENCLFYIYLNYMDNIPRAGDNRNEFYHMSFEDLDGALMQTRAKTGSKVLKAATDIDLDNFCNGTYTLVYWKSTDDGLTWSRHTENITVSGNRHTLRVGDGTSLIDELRVYPEGARVKTRTWEPSIGMTSETDHNGITTYYEYDRPGRIVRILDDDRNVLEEHQYNNLNVSE